MVTSSGKSTSISDHSSSVLNTQESSLGVLSKSLEALTSVGSTVDTRVTRVNLVEVKVRHLEVGLADVERKVFLDTVLCSKVEEHGVKDFIFFRLDICRSKEAVLLDVDCAL